MYSRLLDSSIVTLPYPLSRRVLRPDVFLFTGVGIKFYYFVAANLFVVGMSAFRGVMAPFIAAMLDCGVFEFDCC